MLRTRSRHLIPNIQHHGHSSETHVHSQAMEGHLDDVHRKTTQKPRLELPKMHHDF